MKTTDGDSGRYSGTAATAMKVALGFHTAFCESLAEELHRDVCQQLTAAKLELDLLALESAGGEGLDRARSALSESMRGIRELMESLACERE